MNSISTVPLTGRLGIQRVRAAKAPLFWRLINLPNLWRGWWRHQVASALGVGHFYGRLYLKVRKADGTTLDYGLVSTRVVTTAGVTEIATRFAGTSAASIANFKYHGFGTGTGAEAIGDTGLGTEFTTQYASDSVRPTGNQSAATTVYTTAATFTPDSGGVLAVTEHGIFAQAATGGGTLLDRSKFAAVNIDSSAGDSIVSTYSLSLPAGG